MSEEESDRKFQVGDQVSFIHVGQRMNGTIAYVVDDPYGRMGEYVVKPHPRYRMEEYIMLSECELRGQ